MKVVSLIIMLFASTTALAKGPATTDQNLKLISLIETAFSKPAVISRPRDVRGKDFNFSSYKLKNTPTGQKEFISNFLKLNSLNLIESKGEVHIVQARDAIKMHIPVFKEEVPNDLREQMVVVIKTIPKNLRNKEFDRTLRSHYSSDGDLKISTNKKKIVISDWASNAKKIISIMDSL